VATSEEFQAWMQRYCIWLRTSSLFALSAGVIMLFAASGTLLQARFNYSFETKQVSAMIIFWSFAVATVIFITTLELKEHASSKEKRGVYSMKWKDALRSRKHRFQKDAADLSKLGEDVRDNIHREVEQEEQASYQRCPDAEIVAERGAQYSKLAVDRRLMRGKTRSVIFETLDLPGDTWTPEETKMQLRDVIQEVRNLDEQHANNVDSSTKKQTLNSLFSPTVNQNDGEGATSADEAAAVTVKGDMPIVDANGRVVDMQMLRKLAGQFFRSTLVHVRNGTDSDIRLSAKMTDNGVFEEKMGEYNLRVPREIPAGGEGVFLSRGRPFAGVSGEVEYMTRDRGWSFKLRWSNFVLVGDDGRFCETELVQNSHDGAAAEDLYRIFKEDDDQTVNNEVYFSIKKVPRGVGGTGRTGVESVAISAGWLQVKPASDWVWMKRWASLTAKKLAYYASKTEKVKEGEVKIADITDVYPSGPTELTLVGKEDDQKESSRGGEQSAGPQQLPLRLWFDSTADRDMWMDSLMLASPLLASRNRTSGMSMEAALDELARLQVQFEMNFDQLLALYYRVIHGDKQKVMDRRQTFSAASKLTADEATEAMLLLLVRLLTEEQLQHEREAAYAADGGTDEDEVRQGPPASPLSSDADQRGGVRGKAELLVPGSSSSGASDIDSREPNQVDFNSFSATEWIDVVRRWGGANVWTGLRARDEMLSVGQRLLDAGLIVCVSSCAGHDGLATRPLFSEEVEDEQVSLRYKFVPVRFACTVSALATANMHAPTQEEDDAESSSSRWRRSSAKRQTTDDETFTATEATEWLLARGGNVDHVDGPSGLCEELCQHGLLVHATGAGGTTAANDGGAVQRYAMRRCEGQWDLQLVPAEAAEAKAEASRQVSLTKNDQPDAQQRPADDEDPTTSGQSGAHDNPPVGTLDPDDVHVSQHLHTPTREEFLRHAAADGNEVRLALTYFWLHCVTLRCTLAHTVNVSKLSPVSQLASDGWAGG
jgi:hypothetical protein